MNKSGLQMMNEARCYCNAVAVGEFTPVVFERYEWIGGEKGICWGHPSQTESGRSCIIWNHSSLTIKTKAL